jgi:hypothetical protein
LTYFPCEICFDWCRSLKVIKVWWDAVRNDWVSLKGTDLPTYFAILSVLREMTLDIFYGRPNFTKICSNHSEMSQDKDGYQLTMNNNCTFVPLTNVQKEKWSGYYKSIQIFRNGVVHNLKVQPLNPVFEKPQNPEDSFQNYYRFAPPPSYSDEKNEKEKEPTTIEEREKLRKKKEREEKKRMELAQAVHQFINPVILDIVRTENCPKINFARADYEFQHVERGLFVDLLLDKTTELFKETKIMVPKDFC